MDSARLVDNGVNASSRLGGDEPPNGVGVGVELASYSRMKSA